MMINLGVVRSIGIWSRGWGVAMALVLIRPWIHLVAGMRIEKLLRFLVWIALLRIDHLIKQGFHLRKIEVAKVFRIHHVLLEVCFLRGHLVQFEVS